jgi:protein gp37
LKWDKAVEWSFPMSPSPRVFCASLADWLDEEVPIEWLANLLDLIECTPNLDWLLLTKRPENWLSRITAAYSFATNAAGMIESWGATADSPLAGVCPKNVWLGVSVENQEYADKRIPELLKIPAKVRFLSCEPLLGEVNLEKWLNPQLEVHFNGDKDVLKDADFVSAFGAMIKAAERQFFGIHWVISGGESGPRHRAMDIEWSQSLADQCQAAGVAFFMKQDSGPNPGKQGRLSDKLFSRKEFPA